MNPHPHLEKLLFGFIDYFPPVFITFGILSLIACAPLLWDMWRQMRKEWREQHPKKTVAK